MKQQRTEVICDECKGDSRMGLRGRDALVTCEVHAVDLCELHMRSHFERATCRLVPVEREPDELDRLLRRRR